MKIKKIIYYAIILSVMHSCDILAPDHLDLPRKGEFIGEEVFMTYEYYSRNSKYHVLTVDLGGFTRDGTHDYNVVICDDSLRIVGVAKWFYCLSLKDDTIHIFNYGPNPNYTKYDFPNDFFVKVDDEFSLKKTEPCFYILKGYKYDYYTNCASFELTPDTNSESWNDYLMSMYNVNADTIITVSNNDLYIKGNLETPLNIFNKKDNNIELKALIEISKEKIIKYKKRVYNSIIENSKANKNKEKNNK